jgi:replicative superfamily II helicase
MFYQVLFDLHVIGDKSFAAYEALISTIRTLGFAKRIIGFSTSVTDPRSITAWLKVEPSFTFAYSPQMRQTSFKIQSFDFPTSRARLLAMSRPVYSMTSKSLKSLIIMLNLPEMFRAALDIVNYANIDGQQS